MTPPLDSKDIAGALTSPRWSALARTGLSVAEVGTWDTALLRDTRVMVPVDLQALYVPEGDKTLYVRLPFALTTPDGRAAEPMPAPFAAGVTRPPGVHLHWAAPDALLDGVLAEADPGTGNRLGLPPLPDRWVVLRLVVPMGASAPVITGWVLEADVARAVPLEKWPAGAQSIPPVGKTLGKADLTGTAGGTLNWTGVYDAVLNRLAFHDSLKDLPAIAPRGVVDDLATYLVAGWWSEPTLDPLDGAETTASLEQRLAELGWRLLDDQEGGDSVSTDRAVESTSRFSVGLESAPRYSVKPRSPLDPGTRAVDPNTTLEDIASPVKTFAGSNSRFVDTAEQVIQTTPGWPRSTILHGVIHGVPVSGPVIADRQPKAAALDAALGVHGDDVAAVMASAGLGATDEERRSLERVLSAFTGQLLSRLGEADGVVDVEEHEHDEGFASRPGGAGPTERLKTGGTAGPLAAGRAARGRLARTSPARTGGKPAKGVKFSTLGTQRTDLLVGTADGIRDVVADWGVPRRPVEPVSGIREVQRPAPRFHLPIDPVVGVRNGRRSLRHRGDGRFSPDGSLQCLWPTQIPTRVEGVVEGKTYIASLPNGALPPEVLTLARNALVTDPYLVPWLARTEATMTGGNAGLLQNRLAAEAALRFGRDGVYDGRTPAFQDAADAAGLSGVQVGDQLRRFSLVAGADADPVGVTAWSQPWIPLWLEWEATLLASERLEGWRLGQVDFESAADLAMTKLPAVAGRSPLHTGTATTLAAGIRDWLDAEQARDTTNDGEADETVEAQLADIAGAIDGLDIVTASLDGIRASLLGLPVDGFGVTSPKGADGTVNLPVPVSDSAIARRRHAAPDQGASRRRVRQNSGRAGGQGPGSRASRSA